MERKKNGFTLVELLAVIVVLAIIMVIAIPNVIGSLNDAKRSTFAEYVTKVFNAAVTKFETQALTKDPSDWVYNFDISELGMANTGSYEGAVFVVPTTDGSKKYFIALRDGELQFLTSAADLGDKESYLPTNGADSSITNRGDLGAFSKTNCTVTVDNTDFTKTTFTCPK